MSVLGPRSFPVDLGLLSYSDSASGSSDCTSCSSDSSDSSVSSHGRPADDAANPQKEKHQQSVVENQERLEEFDGIFRKHRMRRGLLQSDAEATAKWSRTNPHLITGETKKDATINVINLCKEEDYLMASRMHSVRKPDPPCLFTALESISDEDDDDVSLGTTGPPSVSGSNHSSLASRRRIQYEFTPVLQNPTVNYQGLSGDQARQAERNGIHK